MSNKVQFRHQTIGTKSKCIDRVYIKVIDCRIRDQMDKMTMNQSLLTSLTPSHLVAVALYIAAVRLESIASNIVSWNLASSLKRKHSHYT